ncbi:MAG: hypothetical protein CL868_02775 [Cytophagaceae bacterium]|nr:hypothetical protein [Cytophagaceae bacterium]
MTEIKTLKKRSSTFGKLRCKFFGHSYRLLRRYNTDDLEYECKCCKRQFTYDETGNLTPLTPRLRHLHEALEVLQTRRPARTGS